MEFERQRGRAPTWRVAVTTVPRRRHDLLPRTLAALERGGFPKPRLFVDGVPNGELPSWEREFGCEVTGRFPVLRTFGNWVLALAELYLRDPLAGRYAVFQDDLTCGRNLRQYLDVCPVPVHGYYNLYTFPNNQARCPTTAEGKMKVGWFLSDQLGKGAVGLVFPNEAAITLLTHSHMVRRPQDAHRGWRVVDGGIVEAMKKAGWREYVHNPSLVQHTGHVSSMGNLPHQQAVSYRGDSYNYLDLLPCTG